MRVLIYQQRGWGLEFGHYLAKKIKEEYPGSEFAAIVMKRQTLDFITSQKDIFYNELIFYDDLQNNPEKYIDDEKLTLQKICDELGIDSVWPLMQSMRNHVKDHSRKYYYSFKQQVSDDILRLLIKATFSMIKKLVDGFKPDIVISPNFVGLQHLMMNLYCQRNGIKMVCTTDTKIKGVYIWVENYFETEGLFHRVYKEYCNNESAIEPALKERAKKYITNFRNDYIPQEGNVRVKNTFKFTRKGIKRLILSNKYLLTLLLFLRGQKSEGWKIVTPENKPRRLILRDFYCNIKYTRALNNWNFDVLNGNEEYIYFPLQVQPEESVDVTAPYFNNQIEVVRQVAMSLPGDLTLVVKEHPAMIGLRPPSYLEKVQKLPNVKFVDYRIRAYDLIKNAKAVVSINSTALVEAAFLGIPSLQLGDLGKTLLLPYVSQCTDMKKLSGKIKEMLERKYNEKDYEHYLLSYIAAAYKTGFETNYVGMWEYGQEGNKIPIWETLKIVINEIIKSK